MLFFKKNSAIFIIAYRPPMVMVHKMGSYIDPINI